MHNQITFCVGRMKLEQGYPREALTLLDQVVAQNPGFGLARLNRARAWLTLGQTGKAVDEMDVFIGGLSSSAPDYYLERADMAMALDTGGYPRAVAGLEEGVARLGPLVTLVQRLVDLHQGQDDTDRALAALQSLPPALRGLPAWQARAGDIHRQAGDEIAAAAAYRRALAGIEALPAGRRSVPAVVELREEACLKLADCINCCVSAGANN
jgi:tetratricopeptide (TPR) repeat protein